MASEDAFDLLIGGVLMPMCHCFEWIINGICSFFCGLKDVFTNTWEDDIHPALPEWDGTKTRFSDSFSEYQLQLEPFIENLLDQFPFIIAFSSFVLPVVVSVILISYCCCSSSDEHLDEVDAMPVQGTNQQYIFEGKRWLRQAEFDFNAAYNDLSQAEKAPEWTCIKCQQAVEKAIKAVIISKGRTYSTGWFGGTQSNISGHDLYDNANNTGDSHLKKLASNLQRTIGFTSRMRYPDKHPYPKVPHDVFTESQAKQALDLSSEIIHYIKSTFF